MTSPPRRILVTSALPYANGAIHIGHLVEYIQTDIWARFQKLCGHECYYVCADDTHGTPIMLKAEQDGITPEQLIQDMQGAHQRDFKGFLIDFDHYSSTHSDENRDLSGRIYLALREAGHINRRTIRQFYDPERGIFLPDRFIRGECPKCHAADQYGDGCEVCNSTYSPTDLLNPISAVSGACPEERETEHLFFKLPDFTSMLKEWVRGGHLQDEVANKLDEWFDTGLKEWDISRDAPYFGFAIPGETDKYFYVWLDAPIGYLASFQQLCNKRDIDYDEFVNPDGGTELYHFIGKDIMYFHCLFWPAMLHAAGLRKPTAVCVHGFLTVNGKKMSKTRGTFIKAETWLQHLDAEYLRYYFAAKLTAGLEDIDLNLDDFVARVNSDLVGKVVNIASRCARFIEQRFAGQLGETLAEPALYDEFVAGGEEIRAAYEARNYASAMRRIMVLAGEVNYYIDQNKPWVMAKQEGADENLQAVCTMGLNLFRMLSIFLKPVLPDMTRRTEQLFGGATLCWEDHKQPLLGQGIQPFAPLMTRVTKKQVAAVVNASKADLMDSGTHAESSEAATDNKDEDSNGQISIDDFARLELRVAEIIAAEHVEGADRLLSLSIDMGDKQCRVLAGIRAAYTPEELTGRLTVVVANLAPRKTRFGVSEAMVLAAGPGGKDIFLLSPDSGAKAGMRVT